MKIIGHLIFGFVLLVFAQYSAASPKLIGNITELWVNDTSNSNIAFITVGQNFTSPCRSGDLRYLVMDLSEPGMREAYSMALAAFMGNKKVYIAGVGTCHGNYEKLKYIYMLK